MSYISSMPAFAWLLNEIVFVTFCALWKKKSFAYTFCSQDVKQNKKWSHTVLIHFLKEPCLLIVIKVSPFHCHQFTFFTFSFCRQNDGKVIAIMFINSITLPVKWIDEIASYHFFLFPNPIKCNGKRPLSHILLFSLCHHFAIILPAKWKSEKVKKVNWWNCTL